MDSVVTMVFPYGEPCACSALAFCSKEDTSGTSSSEIFLGNSCNKAFSPPAGKTHYVFYALYMGFALSHKAKRLEALLRMFCTSVALAHPFAEDYVEETRV